jgi:uncharacterized protein (TIGR03083 family)
MQWSRYLECLDSDYAHLREAVALDLEAPVPTCPGWTVTDLARHVGAVYLHKTEAIRTGQEPEQWPPAGLDDENPLTLLDRAFAELRGELHTRPPAEPAGGWYRPDQTVGFWIRRMCQETVIHRVDAQLAVGRPVTAVPADLAVDGIDELLTVFLEYGVNEWPEFFSEAIASTRPSTVLLSTGVAGWRVEMEPGSVRVVAGATVAGSPNATVSGPAVALLRWLWNRQIPGEPGEVAVTGSPEAIDVLRRCLVVATQ